MYSAPCSRENRAVQGRIFDLQRFSIHDGPGIRTTVFLKGCPLRCRWCHNPEGIDPQPVLLFRAEKCIGCGSCFRICPQNAHVMQNGTHNLERAKCARCGLCGNECYAGALEMAGRTVSVGEIMDVVLRDRPFYETSHGGITLSGGEPLAQPDFAAALLQEARNQGISTAVETSAFLPWELLQEISPLVDHFLVDLKHTDPERHKALTGVPNQQIIENIRRMIQRQWPLVLRIPWVPGQNAGEEFIAGIVAFLQSLANPPLLEFMRYHRLGTGKCHAMGQQPQMSEEASDVSQEDMDPWVEMLLQAGIKVVGS